MPSDFPRSPRVLRGALVTVDPLSQATNVIAFQYNPDTMTRRLDARAMGGEGGDRAEVYRLLGPPRETITLNVEIDGIDQHGQAPPPAGAQGIYPLLSALEMLLYPRSDAVVDNAARSRQGDIEIIPPEAPLTLFVWGERRVLPVRLTGFSITEEEYDTELNPIRAKVDLTLEVLSYVDFRSDHRGYEIFLTHQRAKENLAARYVTGSAAGLGVSLRI